MRVYQGQGDVLDLGVKEEIVQKVAHGFPIMM